ncbi:hypothetical protein [Micromonospora chokoriensis]
MLRDQQLSRTLLGDLRVRFWVVSFSRTTMSQAEKNAEQNSCDWDPFDPQTNRRYRLRQLGRGQGLNAALFVGTLADTKSPTKA